MYTIEMRMVSCMEATEEDDVVPEYSLVTPTPGATPPSPGATSTPAVAPSSSTTGARVTAGAEGETIIHCIKQHNYQYVMFNVSLVEIVHPKQSSSRARCVA